MDVRTINQTNWLAEIGESIDAVRRTTDKSTLLTDKHEGHVHMDTDNHGECLHEMFERECLVHPEATAVIYDGAQRSYADLNRSANQLAWCLRSCNVTVEDRVAICLNRGISMIASILAALKAGAAYVPLDPQYPLERLQQMVEDASPSILITDDELLNKLPLAVRRTISLTRDHGRIGHFAHTNISRTDVNLNAGSLAWVLYTSGSTGRPKGIAMEHRALVNSIIWQRDRQYASKRQRTLQFAALGFDVAFQEIFNTLCNGGTLVLVTEPCRRDMTTLLDVIYRNSIQRLFIPPAVLDALSIASEASPDALNSLEDVITAGEQLRITPSIRRFFMRNRQCRLHNHYGPTETHVATAKTMEADPNIWCALPSIGTPILNSSVYILNDEGQPCPTGASGEIYIGGAGVARGYLNRPQLTEERFVKDPFTEKPTARMYCSGDVGRWLPDGSIEFVGRNDSQIKLRGFRIELREIELALQSHPAVNQAIVVLFGDDPTSRELVGYVVTSHSKTDASLKQKQDTNMSTVLSEFLSSKLPHYMVPSAIVVLGEFPITPIGKIDRGRLPAPRQRDEWIRETDSALHTPTEITLERLWNRVLNREHTDVDSEFRNLGGNSLQSMLLGALVSEAFSVDTKLISSSEYSSIREMARRIDDLRFEKR